MKNPRFANELGGILLSVDDEGSHVIYVDHGELYEAALAGAFGPIAEYVPPPPPPVVIPQSVTMRQARLALLGIGLLDDVHAAIAAIPDPVQRKAAEIEWEYAQTVDRNSPFTQQMAAGLNLTAEQLDALFTQAAGL